MDFWFLIHSELTQDFNFSLSFNNEGQFKLGTFLLLILSFGFIVQFMLVSMDISFGRNLRLEED